MVGLHRDDGCQSMSSWRSAPRLSCRSRAGTTSIHLVSRASPLNRTCPTDAPSTNPRGELRGGPTSAAKWLASVPCGQRTTASRDPRWTPSQARCHVKPSESLVSLHQRSSCDSSLSVSPSALLPGLPNDVRNLCFAVSRLQEFPNGRIPIGSTSGGAPGDGRHTDFRLG